MISCGWPSRGRVLGVAMRHPNGGPVLALRLDPERAAAARAG